MLKGHSKEPEQQTCLKVDSNCALNNYKQAQEKEIVPTSRSQNLFTSVSTVPLQIHSSKEPMRQTEKKEEKYHTRVT